MKIMRNLIKIFIILLLLELFIFFIEIEQQSTEIANEPQEIMLTDEIKEEIEETAVIEFYTFEWKRRSCSDEKYEDGSNRKKVYF